MATPDTPKRKTSSEAAKQKLLDWINQIIGMGSFSSELKAYVA
ncbi:hypothetical protein [uncultured Gimesia sp.]